MDNQNNNHNNNFNRDRNHFNRDRNFDRRDHRPRFDNQGGGQRFERADVTFKDKSDDQIIQLLLDKQKKIGRNVFGSDIHPLYELIIRQNKRIKALEEKLGNTTSTNKTEPSNSEL
jgi:hypothetical protein